MNLECLTSFFYWGREDPFVSLSDSDVEQEAINELDSDDENDEIIDI